MLDMFTNLGPDFYYLILEIVIAIVVIKFILSLLRRSKALQVGFLGILGIAAVVIIIMYTNGSGSSFFGTSGHYVYGRVVAKNTALYTLQINCTKTTMDNITEKVIVSVNSDTKITNKAGREFTFQTIPQNAIIQAFSKSGSLNSDGTVTASKIVIQTVYVD